MKISREEFVKLDSSKLFELVSSKTDKYYRFFHALRMSKARYDKTITLLIENTRDYYNCSEDFDDFVTECLLEYLKETIKELYQNPSEYIFKSFGIKVKEVRENEAVFFLEIYHEIMSSLFSEEEIENITEELLKYDSLLNSSLYKIFSKHRNEIIDGAVPKVINNINLMIYVDYYCSMSNIDIYSTRNRENEKDRRDVETEELNEFYREIRDFKKQTKEEERECFLRIRNGDIEARKELMNANLRIVVNIARDYAYCGVPLMELINEGTIAMIKAIDNFDLDREVRFSTFIYNRIRTAIVRAIDKLKRTISLSVNACEIIRKLARRNNKLSQELYRFPTREELSKETGIDIKTLEELLIASEPTLSIDRSSNNDKLEEDSDELSCEEIISDISISPVEEIVLKRISKETLLQILDTFNERDREIMYHLFGFYDEPKKTLEEVGKIYNVSRQAIGQIKNRIIKEIRKPKNIMLLATSDEISKPVKEDYKNLVEEDDTVESLIDKIIECLPNIESSHITMFFDSLRTDNIDNKRFLFVKYDYTEEQIDEITKTVSKEISKNEKAKYLYYRIIERKERTYSQEIPISQVKPSIKLVKVEKLYEDQYDLEIINYTLDLLNDPIMQEVIDEELFEHDLKIIKCLERNQESDDPKSLEEFLSKLNLSIEQVKETAFVCLDFYFERKYNIITKNRKELKDVIYKRLIQDMLVCC